jgi:predicted SAM-dependent methyltransferase
MVWRLEEPQGNESGKVRFDVLPYCKSGIDIGCGPSKVWPHLIGVDSGLDGTLFGIQMKPDIVCDARRLAMFASGSMQTVFSSHTLEHIEDHRAALAEWWRLVAPGGHLIVYLPHADWYPNIGQPGANPDHKHDFRNEDITSAMSEIAKAGGHGWDLLVDETRSQEREYSFLQIYRKRDDARCVWAIAPKPEKSVGVVRVGGHGDALWASSILPHLKEQGYHVTVYAAHTGAEILRHDPNIDRLITLPDGVLTDDELLAYWAHEAAKHDRWINLIGSVETRLLAHPNELAFYHPHWLRHKLMNRNYLEVVHEYAGLDGAPFRQKYYPTVAEQTAARKIREMSPGPVVVINPAGSGPVKTWPHTQRLMKMLAEAGVYSVVLGDLRAAELDDVEPYGYVVGMQWPVRMALAFALQADAVVATESLIANAVAFEPMPKVITLSHSSAENLTKHWLNTIAIEPHGVACHPCHRIHPPHFGFCSRDKTTGASACQAVVTADTVAELVLDALRAAGKLPVAEKEAA